MMKAYELTTMPAVLRSELERNTARRMRRRPIPYLRAKRSSDERGSDDAGQDIGLVSGTLEIPIDCAEYRVIEWMA